MKDDVWDIVPRSEGKSVVSSRLIKYRQEQQHGGKGSLANTKLFTPMLHIYSTMGDATS
jgi:hypothetical protein